METIKLTSNFNIILSEDENSDSSDAKFIICDFSPNANNVSLNRDTIENWIDTLKFKPLVGKVVTRFDGKRDFSGHNAKIVEETDENGNKIKSIEFDTSAFGSFYEVGIETIDDIEYIVAKSKVWKRYKESYAIFKKRVESQKGLKTSWELTVSESHQETIDGKDVKVIDEGCFIGHAVLGEFVQPAYKSSGVLEVASEIVDDELAIALSNDLLLLSEENSDDESEINKNNTEGGNEMPKENEQELSALTDNDIYSKVRKAINSANEDRWYYISMLYPYDYKCVAYTWDRASEEDYVEFQYSVNSDDTISITSQQDVKLKFVPVAEIESQIAELQSKVEESEKEIAEAGKQIVELSKEKETLETQVAELIPFKEKVDELEKAEMERQLAELSEQLKSYALEDELITSEEIDSNDVLSSIFAELTIENFEASKEKVDVVKGKKAIAIMRKRKQCANEESSEKETEVSETKEEHLVSAKSDLNEGSEEGVLSATDIVKMMLGKK